MNRKHYRIFSSGQIAGLTLPNRLVRSATWDPCILGIRKMTDEVLDLYREVALGGTGLIITGAFPVLTDGMLDGNSPQSFAEVEVEGAERLVEVVRSAAPDCRIIAQLETGYLNRSPSGIPSPFEPEPPKPFSREEIRRIVLCFVEAIVRMKAQGFDGVQLHACHGGVLSQFLSPYTNRRSDEYGGDAASRVRIVREIVSEAREQVGDYPILIKMNGTDYVEGGIDIDNFCELAREIQSAGIDAVEVSGGMWDCLVRPEEELGFRPVPSPESHTRINDPAKQSYFLPYAEKLKLDIPVILVGGNKDIERLEEIINQNKADFVALCRPLIHETDLPNRWMENRGSSTTGCISCNSCLYDMWVHPGRQEPALVNCVFKRDKSKHQAAQEWLTGWVEKNATGQAGHSQS